ncbi:hypothetical protein GLOTRDRAFT_129450 [Gloeophyllum trabeum ATCC 11539]|uniref:Uncharacterized protein n=1 Tax=Gloeophyllum trabeum (strain ATCC 11539 / FP-39264 / Madison 617) TaxID=670483 RepID=S7Q6L2_GLOTA|nr:uncharacterized protein GLOTRDRAFT_129450 [Gloeophyllum trabeum ATCC 11539]EPQ55157.1 hypothetical protein GLOTRDRAFT_129450 [Gloeophyllum trabeum ATCC 11539]
MASAGVVQYDIIGDDDTGMSEAIIQSIQTELERNQTELARLRQFRSLSGLLRPGSRLRQMESCQERITALQSRLAEEVSASRDRSVAVSLSIDELLRRVDELEISVQATGGNQDPNIADPQHDHHQGEAEVRAEADPVPVHGRDMVRGLPPLRFVRLLTGVNGIAAEVQPVSFERMRQNPAGGVKEGTSQLKNLAFADPDSLYIPHSYLHIKNIRKCGVFFTVGFCTWSTLHRAGDDQPEICVTPSQTTWPRLCSVVGAVLDANCLYTSTFRNGVAFSTTRRKNVVNGTPVKQPPKHPRLIPGNVHVEVFDGRNEPFELSQYRQLPPFPGPVPPRTAVVVIYTISRYQYRGPIPAADLTWAVGFNVLDVVVVANPHECVWDGPVNDHHG